MKIQITENDIKNMVYHGVKRAIMENVDIRDVIGDLPLPKVAKAFEAVYPDSVAELKSNNGNFGAMLDTICNAYEMSPTKQKAEFRAQLGVEPTEAEEPQGEPAGIPDMIGPWTSEGGSDDEDAYSSNEPVDFELDDTLMGQIKEMVNRVVNAKLNEITQW